MRLLNQFKILFANRRKSTMLLLYLAILVLVGSLSLNNKEGFFDKFKFSADNVIDGTYYISPDGMDVNERDGSSDSPWHTVEYALGKTGAGHTIIFKPGIYPSFIVGVGYKGTQTAPTILRSETKWGAVIIGSSGHGIYTGNGCDWVIVDGFEVMGASIDGIKLQGNYSSVRNCWVHNNREMGISAHGHANTVIENNLIEFNGTHIQFHHGVYADGDGLLVNKNTVRYNAGVGLQLYPSIKNSVITNNLVYGQHSYYKSGILVACPAGGGNNIVANNTMTNNSTGLVVWDGNGEIISNNIFFNNNSQSSFGSNAVAQNNFNPPGTNPAVNPQFVDSANDDFRLLSTSPAVDAGTSLPDVVADIENTSRPRGLSYDIGAYESVPTINPPTVSSIRSFTYKDKININGNKENLASTVLINDSSDGVVISGNNWSKEVPLTLGVTNTFVAIGSDGYGTMSESSKFDITRRKPGDANGNNTIDKFDFSSLMLNWNKTDTANLADFNEDNVVNKLDFSALMFNWGK